MRLHNREEEYSNEKGKKKARLSLCIGEKTSGRVGRREGQKTSWE